MKLVKCPMCNKPYSYKKCLANHITKYNADGYKVYSTGVHRQPTLAEYV